MIMKRSEVLIYVHILYDSIHMKVQNREMYRDRKVDYCLRMGKERKNDMRVRGTAEEKSRKMAAGAERPAELCCAAGFDLTSYLLGMFCTRATR